MDTSGKNKHKESMPNTTTLYHKGMQYSPGWNTDLLLCLPEHTKYEDNIAASNNIDCSYIGTLVNKEPQGAS